MKGLHLRAARNREIDINERPIASKGYWQLRNDVLAEGACPGIKAVRERLAQNGVPAERTESRLARIEREYAKEMEKAARSAEKKAMRVEKVEKSARRPHEMVWTNALGAAAAVATVLVVGGSATAHALSASVDDVTSRVVDGFVMAGLFAMIGAFAWVATKLHGRKKAEYDRCVRECRTGPAAMREAWETTKAALIEKAEKLAAEAVK